MPHAAFLAQILSPSSSSTDGAIRVRQSPVPSCPFSFQPMANTFGVNLPGRGGGLAGTMQTKQNTSCEGPSQLDAPRWQTRPRNRSQDQARACCACCGHGSLRGGTHAVGSGQTGPTLPTASSPPHTPGHSPSYRTISAREDRTCALGRQSSRGCKRAFTQHHATCCRSLADIAAVPTRLTHAAAVPSRVAAYIPAAATRAGCAEGCHRSRQATCRTHVELRRSETASVSGLRDFMPATVRNSQSARATHDDKAHVLFDCLSVGVMFAARRLARHARSRRPLWYSTSTL